MTAIASVGADLPRDLLAAVGGYAGPLSWNSDAATPRADAWLESKFALWTRSIVEDWAEGRLDHLDYVLFTRGEDNSQRLYYYLCELRRRGLVAGPEPLMFDIARLPRKSSEQRTIASVRKLAERFGVSDTELERAIAATNSARRAGMAPPKAVGPVCLIEGTAPPDRRLHEAVEAAGWTGWGETLADQWNRLGTMVEECSGDPAAAIGRQLHTESFGPRSQYDRAVATLGAARACKARAAVLWYTEQEEALIWHLPDQRRALEEAGIPVLALTRRDWAARDGAANEIHAFLKEIEA